MLAIGCATQESWDHDAAFEEICQHVGAEQQCVDAHQLSSDRGRHGIDCQFETERQSKLRVLPFWGYHS